MHLHANCPVFPRIIGGLIIRAPRSLSKQARRRYHRLSLSRGEPVDMAHLAAGAGLGLAVEVEADAGLGGSAGQRVGRRRR